MRSESLPNGSGSVENSSEQNTWISLVKTGSMCHTRARRRARMETNMKSTNGSKSARTPKTKTEAAEATARPRGKKKAAAPAAEIPDWARTAEVGPLANAASEADPPESHAPEAAFATVAELPRPTPDGPATLKAIADGWLQDMRARGKTGATVASYAGDLALAMKFFDCSRVAGAITSEEITAYEASDLVTKTRCGKPKAQPTVLKTRRALRLALTWARETGLVATIPYAAAS